MVAIRPVDHRVNERPTDSRHPIIITIISSSIIIINSSNNRSTIIRTQECRVHDGRHRAKRRFSSSSNHSQGSNNRTARETMVPHPPVVMLVLVIQCRLDHSITMDSSSSSSSREGRIRETIPRSISRRRETTSKGRVETTAIRTITRTIIRVVQIIRTITATLVAIMLRFRVVPMGREVPALPVVPRWEIVRAWVIVVECRTTSHHRIITLLVISTNGRHSIISARVGHRQTRMANVVVMIANVIVIVIVLVTNLAVNEEATTPTWLSLPVVPAQ